MSSHNYDFRKWIEAGYKNYGKDPWFFIRELAQNSRDAGAKTIRVRIGYNAEKEEVLIFEDDGKGMSYHHAKQYLFRLYASSKGDEKNAAGMFGIGFWTVLKFNPSRIIIESRCGKGKVAGNWGVIVEADEPGGQLKTRDTTGTLPANGTRVTLIRPAVEASDKVFFKKTRSVLRRYCSYLRRNNANADPLPIFFGGQNLTREMSLPGAVSLRFKDRSVEGAVGLGPRPKVMLYARGLPVWEGTTLEELSHTPPENIKNREFGQGLAPVVLLNGNHLEVNISRRKVIDNRHLQRARKVAEQALSQMVADASDTVSPRGAVRRFFDKFKVKNSRSSPFLSFGKTFLLLLLLLVPLEIFLLKVFYPHSGAGEPGNASSRPFVISADDPFYTGASVTGGSGSATSGFRYSPPSAQWFKLFYADNYSKVSGFLQPEETPEESTPPPLDFQGAGVSVQMEVSGEGPIFLPQPLGYGIDPSGITLDRVPVPDDAFQYRASGEAVLRIPGGGTIRYHCRPLENTGNTKRSFFLLPGDLTYPPGVRETLQRATNLGLTEKVRTALRLTWSLLKYDNSSATAKKYAQSSRTGDWFRKVSEIGVGDCDVLNGVTTLFLREMGIPARLVIGAVGMDGKSLSILHAWTEFYDLNGKQIILDSSSSTRWGETGDRQPLEAGQTAGVEMWSDDEGGYHPGEPVGRKEPALSPAGGAGGPDDPSQTLILILAVMIVLLVFFLVVLLIRHSRKRPSRSRPELLQVEKDLAGMALHALLHPNQGAWGNGSGIRHLPLIPTLNGRSVSIEQALQLGTRRKLFTAGKANPLIAYMESASLSSSVPILDAGNSSFAPLVKLLPGAVHLDQVSALKVMPPEKAPASWLGQLVAAVNRQLARTKDPAIPCCLLVTGHMAGDFSDVDLSPLPRLPQWLMPNRFVAVNPYSRELNALAALYQENPLLAQFRFIQTLFKESRLIPEPPGGVMERVSRQLLLHEGEERSQ
ncbi:MAG: hypothetical protein GY940_25545 [bacterium]|nr:hypothetical protein [bacterium]